MSSPKTNFATNVKAKGKVHRLLRKSRQCVIVACGWRIKVSTSLVYCGSSEEVVGTLCMKCFPRTDKKSEVTDDAIEDVVEVSP